jgi:hypothetical protein
MGNLAEHEEEKAVDGTERQSTDAIILGTMDGKWYRVPREQLTEYVVAQSVRFQVGTDVYEVPRDVLQHHEMSDEDVQALRQRKTEALSNMDADLFRNSGFEAAGLGGGGASRGQPTGAYIGWAGWRSMKQSMGAGSPWSSSGAYAGGSRWGGSGAYAGGSPWGGSGAYAGG